MKSLCTLTLLFILVSSCSGQPIQNIHDMTADLWKEDIDYVNKKIQKQFASFDPSIKTKFADRAMALQAEISQLSNPEITIRMGQLLASLRDGHTELNILQSKAGLDRLPLFVRYFDNGLYITEAHEDYKDLIGMKVNRIGNLEVDNSVERLKKVMTYDNDYEILHAGGGFLALPDVLKFLGAVESTSEVTLMLTDALEKNVQRSIPSMSQTEYNNGPWTSFYELNGLNPQLRDKNDSRNYWYEYLKDQRTMYFCLNRLNNEKGQSSIKKTVSKLFKEIDQIKPEKLVIDIRNNTGGNYNLSRPLVEAIKDRSWLNQDGKLYVLNGRKTFSAAMVASIFLKRETEAILVGEPSRGHPNKCDNNEYMTLPNSGLSIEYTTKVEKHWPELGDATYVPVDVEIATHFSDYRIGRDAAMEYAFEQ